jgi:hypothetical protein
MAKSSAAPRQETAARTENRPYRDRAPAPYPANDDNRRRRYHQQDDGPTPIGFGDDIPAFMLTSAAIK